MKECMMTMAEQNRIFVCAFFIVKFDATLEVLVVDFALDVPIDRFHKSTVFFVHHPFGDSATWMNSREYLNQFSEIFCNVQRRFQFDVTFSGSTYYGSFQKSFQSYTPDTFGQLRTSRTFCRSQTSKRQKTLKSAERKIKTIFTSVVKTDHK